MPDRSSLVTILDVPVHNLSREEARNTLAEFIENRNGGRARMVFFANVHSFHVAQRKPGFLETLQKADLVLPDGSGLKIAGWMFGRPIRENLNGTDFTPDLLALAEQKAWSVYLFGSLREVAERAAVNLQVMFPALSIVGYSRGYVDPQEEVTVLEDMRQKKPDIVLVALGSPRQEEWIREHAGTIHAGVCLAVGGLFDFLAGRFRRAPKWVRSLGLEWVYRFFQDPKTKWERVFIEIPKFLAMILLKALSPRKSFPGTLP